jgi:DNA-binding NarL/FixJ family response regulator
VRVVLAEDLFLLRDGLVRLLTAHDFEIAAAVEDAPALLEAMLEHRPDAAIVDVRLPPTFTDDGLRAALEARRQVPGLPVLVLSSTSSSSTPVSCWPIRQAASGTCSRTACSMTTSSSMRSAPWRAAAR